MRSSSNCEDLTAEFCRVAGTLGDQLGALLFQLPPSLKKDLARLDAFLDTLPPKAPAAFEFRHPSWFDAEVFARLKERGRALCVADSEKLETPLEVTADFGYFRLRDEGYQPADIEEWARKIAPLRERCKDIYVYFKHEEQGIGPEFARQLMTHLGLTVSSRLGRDSLSASIARQSTVAAVLSPQSRDRTATRAYRLAGSETQD